MTFWDFLDRQIGRISPTGVAGAGIYALTAAVLWMISSDTELANNELFKMLAQAIVVQGLVGLAMASWFTRRPPDDTPQVVQIEQPPNEPVPVEEAK